MHSAFRNFGSYLNNKMTEKMLFKPKELYVGSYFATRRFVIDEVVKYTGAYPYIMGLILRTTRNICNVNVNHRERAEGTSGYTLSKLIALWVNGFTSFSIIPLRMSSYTGLSIAIIGFVYALIVIIKKIINPEIVIGWSSTIAILLILGGVILLMLGLIGEYVGRIFISINNSPQYVIKSIINYTENDEK